MEAPDDKLNKVLLVLAIAEKLVGFIAGLFGDSSKKVAETKAVTSDSSANDIAKLQEIFNEFRTAALSKAKELESSVTTEVEAYSDGLIFMMEGKKDILKKFNISFEQISRKIGKIKMAIPGTFDNAMSKIISLNNPDCAKVVQMMPGSMKDASSQRLLEQAFKAGLHEIVMRLVTAINELNEDIGDLVNSGFEANTLQLKSIIASLQQVESATQNTESSQRQVHADALVTIGSADLAIYLILEEV